jgi:hypothetical protein
LALSAVAADSRLGDCESPPPPEVGEEEGNEDSDENDDERAAGAEWTLAKRALGEQGSSKRCGPGR